MKKLLSIFLFFTCPLMSMDVEEPKASEQHNDIASMYSISEVFPSPSLLSEYSRYYESQTTEVLDERATTDLKRYIESKQYTDEELFERAQQAELCGYVHLRDAFETMLFPKLGYRPAQCIGESGFFDDFEKYATWWNKFTKSMKKRLVFFTLQSEVVDDIDDIGSIDQCSDEVLRIMTCDSWIHYLSVFHENWKFHENSKESFSQAEFAALLKQLGNFIENKKLSLEQLSELVEISDFLPQEKKVYNIAIEVVFVISILESLVGPEGISHRWGLLTKTMKQQFFNHIPFASLSEMVEESVISNKSDSYDIAIQTAFFDLLVKVYRKNTKEFSDLWKTLADKVMEKFLYYIPFSLFIEMFQARAITRIDCYEIMLDKLLHILKNNPKEAAQTWKTLRYRGALNVKYNGGLYAVLSPLMELLSVCDIKAGEELSDEKKRHVAHLVNEKLGEQQWQIGGLAKSADIAYSLGFFHFCDVFEGLIFDYICNHDDEFELSEKLEQRLIRRLDFADILRYKILCKSEPDKPEQSDPAVDEIKFPKPGRCFELEGGFLKNFKNGERYSIECIKDHAVWQAVVSDRTEIDKVEIVRLPVIFTLFDVSFETSMYSYKIGMSADGKILKITTASKSYFYRFDNLSLKKILDFKRSQEKFKFAGAMIAGSLGMVGIAGMIGLIAKSILH